MIKFKKSNRDESATKDGKDVEIYHVDGTLYGTFKVSYLDYTSNAFRLAIMDRNKRMTKPEIQRMVKPMTDADLDFQHKKQVEFFVDFNLKGWDVTDADDKAIPFNRENAIEYLIHYRWIFNGLEEFALNEENFLNVTKVDIAKN